MPTRQLEARSPSRLRDRATWALLPIVVCGALAFRQLFVPDPATFGPQDIEGTESWLFSPTGGSPVLVYVITAWLVVRRVPRLVGGSTGPAHLLLGAMGLAVAAIGSVWAHFVSAQQILVPCLAIALVSAGGMLGGSEGSRAMWLPAGFLALLATPIPTPILNAVIYPMQHFTAGATASVLRAVGLSAQQAGVLIVTPKATFYVIETCAGLRTVQTLVLTAVVYAEVFHRSRSRLVELVVVSVGIGVVVNLGRVISLVLLTGGQPQPEHTVQGVAMVVAGVLLLAGVDELLERIHGRSERVVRSSGLRASPARGSVPVGRIAAVSAALLTLAVTTWWMPVWRARGLDYGSVHDVPRVLGEWTMKAPALAGDEKFMGSTRFSARTWRVYEKAGDTVELYFGMNDRLRRYTGLVSRKTELLRADAVPVERHPVRLAGLARPATELVVVGASGERWLVHHWYENVGNVCSESLRNALALDRGRWRRTEPARVIRLATRIGADAGSVVDGRRRLLDFESRLADALDALGPRDRQTPEPT